MNKISGTDALAISAAEITVQLQRICASDSFDASERNRRFLTYVVERSLAGHADQIKGYCIATEVFGRDASFDPLLDPIVRIEASRLRRSLERYYLTAGAGDPIRIDIPKGSYVPSFAPLAPTSAMPERPHPEPEITREQTPSAPIGQRSATLTIAVLCIVALLGVLAT